MNKEPHSTAFISENAVRGALDRRWRNLRADVDAGDGRPIQIPAGDHAVAPTNRSRRLRRWSVADLIARAIARPPNAGLAR
jgi:hypothetical protein